MTDTTREALAAQATDPQELERQIMSPTVPKNEREHWAAREIERLRDCPAAANAAEAKPEHSKDVAFSALQTIIDYQIADPENVDAANMKLIAIDAMTTLPAPMDAQPSEPLPRARKVGGSYQAEGTIVGSFKTLAGEQRYVFEFDPPVQGMLHIFGPSQLDIEKKA